MNTLVRAWRSLTWKHWAWATAAPILLAMTGPLQSFHQNRYWALWRILTYAPWLLFFSYTTLIAIVLAEASARHDAPAVWRYLAALLASSAIYAAAVASFPEWVISAPKEIRSGQVIAPPAIADPQERAREYRTRVLFRIPAALSYGWVAAFIYVRLRNSRLAARALANAEIERSEAQRKLLAAQLVAVHAQVDPAFVLEKLEEVERAYEADPARADALLDEFIAFLRDAIPRLRAEEGGQAA